jgi:glycosyltransferase involved in cell wall biosynthesis
VRKVLYVSHNHSSIRPGGAEIYAEELHRAIGRTSEFASLFVARVAEPVATHDGSRLARAESDPTLYFLHTGDDEFDRLLVTARSKRLYVEDWRGFLRAQKPDIVHFHHSALLGYDMIRETRRTLPRAGIVYTLHDFGPICHHDGQMVRTGTYALCRAASAPRCHECFPKLLMQDFLARERFVKSALELVDLFITPSEHARHTFIEWGLPHDRVVHEDYGRFPVPALPDPPNAGRRRTIGFFGQVTRYKGIDVLLEAMKLLCETDTDVRLLLFASGIERAQPEFRARLNALLAEASESVKFQGRYEQAALPALLSAIDWMVVPSIWWETGPLVIHEARLHGRPVICSDIGAMVERIEHGVNGLHFRVGDPRSLAAAIRRAVDTPGLWDELRARMTDPHSMDAHLQTIAGLYRGLCDRRSPPLAA